MSDFHPNRLINVRQKGFTSILIGVIIAFIAIAGISGYVLVSKNSQPKQSENNEAQKIIPEILKDSTEENSASQEVVPEGTTQTKQATDSSKDDASEERIPESNQKSVVQEVPKLTPPSTSPITQSSPAQTPIKVQPAEQPAAVPVSSWIRKEVSCAGKFFDTHVHFDGLAHSEIVFGHGNAYASLKRL